ncbi:unnamed protein product [Cunninghamella blakesleeana]
MGNTDSAPIMTETVVSNLPKKTQQRLSHAQTVKKHQPNSFSYFETAAVTRAPKPKPLPSSNGSNSSKKASSKANSASSVKSKSSSEIRSHQSPLSSVRGSVISLPETAQLKLTFSTLNGRRYLTTPGTYYFLPVDDDEADRLVILHFLLKYALKGNVVAPVSNALKHSKAQVLDIGCGCGTWILEMAAEFPSSEFYGIDILPSFPGSVKPSNAHFSQHNFLGSLPFPDNSLDYIHMRTMLNLLSIKQLQKLLIEIARVLKPLGTIEIIDVDYRIQRPGPLSQSLLNEELHTALHKHHIDLLQCHQLSKLLMSQKEHHGFVDVHQQQITIPIGWGGQVGQIHSQCLESFYQSLNPVIRDAVTTSSTNPLWQPSDIDYTSGLSNFAIQQVMKECIRYQSHLNWYTVYAQKSLIPSSALSSPRMLSSKSMSPSVSSTIECLPPQPVSESMVDGNWDTINQFIDGFTD